MAALLRDGIADGSVDAAVEVDDTAILLVSLVDGLGTRVLAGVIERDDALRLIERTLATELAHRQVVTR